MANGAGTPVGGLRGALQAQLEQLSPAMRVAFGFLLSMMAFVWLLFIWWFLYGTIDAKAEDIRLKKRNLTQIEQLYAEYQAAQSRISQAEERLKESAGGKPSGFIEKTASQAGVREQLSAVQEQDTEDLGNLKQTRYRVELKRAPLSGALDFLYGIETAGFMQVEQADFRTHFVSGEKRVTLSLSILTFQSAEAP